MSESLYRYYERELLFIRQLAQDFARQYPAAAGRLLLEPNRSVDPHVERLIEAFALVAARVHHKIDDDFPELTDALLGILYPHYLAPIPSLAIAQFVPDAAQTPLNEGFRIERGSRLHTQPINEVPCKYRTCYPVTLWPLAVAEARLHSQPFPAGLQPPPRTAAVLRLRLECLAGAAFAELTLDRLRLFLAGEDPLLADLYELIFNHTTQVVLRPAERGGQSAIVLSPRDCLRQVGFEPDEGLLPYPRRSFPGYRLLTELFAFPAKFHFLDLGGLRALCQPAFGSRAEIVLFLNRTIPTVEQGVEASTFLLGCTPIVNLFEQIAEPIALTQTRSEYRIVPDVAAPLGLEVYSVDGVSSSDPIQGVTTEYQPFYSFRHGVGPENQQTFWYAARRPSLHPGDRGTDVFLNLVDLGFQPSVPAEQTLVVRTTCTNRDLPVQLRQAGDRLYLELEAAAPLARLHCVRIPTAPSRPPLRRGAQWRLISHLSLNHLSITDVAEGREALQELLRLYDFSDPEAGQAAGAVNRQLIDGILSVSSRRVIGRTGSAAASGFCRGVEIAVEFDEQKYVGTGLFLFASVLERFFGLYTSLNSFSQLTAKTRQREELIKKWPPRAGDVQIL
ncbi:MAG TPA: type VI secretion system baseplate subunit TssF [Gemmataceae bacterium]|nr:type VI secretion system baseplate subunit TssF [Gemmataceae bacterium]